MTNPFADFIAERNKALEALDMDYLRRMMPDATDEIRILAAHKARLECVGLPDAVRHESRQWLQQRGYKRFDSTPVTDDLPR